MSFIKVVFTAGLWYWIALYCTGIVEVFVPTHSFLEHQALNSHCYVGWEQLPDTFVHIQRLH